MIEAQEVLILYTNYKGVTSWRRIKPMYMSFDANEWHTEPQWLLYATDLDKGEGRSFAMKDIHCWAPPHHITYIKEITDATPNRG